MSERMVIPTSEIFCAWCKSTNVELAFLSGEFMRNFGFLKCLDCKRKTKRKAVPINE